MTWYCDEPEYAQYVDNYHGHILTGNLAIVQSGDLRNLMAKGAKYRESPRMSYNRIEKSLYEYIDNYSEKWSSKERKDNFEEQLRHWTTKMKARVKDRLENVKLQWPNLNHNIILEKLNVKEELSRVQESDIITVVDKAANNFAF